MARIARLVDVSNHKVAFLQRFPFRIGRDKQCELFIQAVEVSREHASVNRGFLGGYRITDLGSTNGTYVNHKRIGEPAPVTEGDLVTLGLCASKPAGAAHLYFTFEETSQVKGALDALRKQIEAEALKDSLLGAEPAEEGEHTTSRLFGKVTVVFFKRSRVSAEAEQEAVLREVRASMARAPRPWLVVSFQGVEVAPVGLLGSLVLVQQELRQRGGDLHLAAIGPALLALFQVGALDGALAQYRSEKEAVRAFQRSTLETQF